MAATTLVSVEEYLHSSYDPDREYVEGQLRERNVGEISHSDAQTACVVYIRTMYKRFWSVVEVRVQVKAERFRVPDVTIVAGKKPTGRIITEPPVAVVEVLSPEDRAADMQERIDDYLGFGISCVWVVNPENHRGWVHTPDGSREAKDGILRTPDGQIEVPLSAIFAE